MEYLIKTCTDKGFPCPAAHALASPLRLQPGEAAAGGKRSVRVRNLWSAPARAFNKTAAAFESQRQLRVIRVF